MSTCWSKRSKIWKSEIIESNIDICRKRLEKLGVNRWNLTEGKLEKTISKLVDKEHPKVDYALLLEELLVDLWVSEHVDDVKSLLDRIV